MVSFVNGLSRRRVERCHWQISAYVSLSQLAEIDAERKLYIAMPSRSELARTLIGEALAWRRVARANGKLQNRPPEPFPLD